MINLIPLSAKHKLIIEYWIRVVSVWLILWSIILFICTALLLPVYVLLQVQTATHEDYALTHLEQSEKYEKISQSLQATGYYAKTIVDEEKLNILSGYIDLFKSLQAENLQINQIAFTRSELDLSPVTIQGLAQNRQALADFRDRLLTSALVDNVDLPISNLESDKDIIFSITVDLSKP